MGILDNSVNNSADNSVDNFMDPVLNSPEFKSQLQFRPVDVPRLVGTVGSIPSFFATGPADQDHQHHEHQEDQEDQEDRETQGQSLAVLAKTFSAAMFSNFFLQ